MKWIVSVSLLLMALLMGEAAYADRNIVYAARYYTPPDSQRTSHFHLYRINPDGTSKTQLTYGSDDDDGPSWSPDGRRIAFTRQSMTGRIEMCLIEANGGTVTSLTGPGMDPTDGDYTYHWSPDAKSLAVGYPATDKEGASVSLFSPQTGKVTRRFSGVHDFLGSPDSLRAYFADTPGGRIVDLGTGKETRLGADFSHPVWLNNTTLVGFSSDERTEQHYFRFLSTDGQEKKRVPLNMPATYQEVVAEGGFALLGGLLRANSLLYALNNHNSTVGVDYLFFSLDAATGAAHYLSEGQFLACSPDGTKFCIAPGRDTTPYDKRRYAFAVLAGASAWEKIENEYRLVWSAPLYVRATVGGPMRALTPRLSWVTGADWRKQPTAAWPRNR